VADVLSAEVDVAAIRARFSSLRQGFAFYDAPGGTQVPDEVGEAELEAKGSVASSSSLTPGTLPVSFSALAGSTAITRPL